MTALWLLMLAAPQFVGAPVPDTELADARGGFRLPNGIDVALTVQTQTAVDGAVVLRTVFKADQGAATLTAYAPKPGETVASAPVAAGGAAAVPTITYDPRGGIQVTRGVATTGVGIAPAAGAGADALPAGLVQVDGGAMTDHGAVSAAADGGVRTVSLSGTDLTVTHLAGTAFGSAIANSGNDRTIDTQTTVSIGLSNAGPDVLGSAMFRVQDVAIEAATMRLP